MKTGGERICWSIVHKYANTLDKEEAYQESMIAAAKALAAYQEDHTRTKKTTYVYQAVYNQIKMMLREDTSQKRALEKNCVPADTCIAVKSSANLEEDTLDRFVEEERAASLYAAIDRAGLTWEEYYIIRAQLKNVIQNDICTYLGCSQSYVSKNRSSAIKKIHKCLLDAGWDGTSAYFFDLCS